MSLLNTRSSEQLGLNLFEFTDSPTFGKVLDALKTSLARKKMQDLIPVTFAVLAGQSGRQEFTTILLAWQNAQKAGSQSRLSKNVLGRTYSKEANTIVSSLLTNHPDVAIDEDSLLSTTAEHLPRPHRSHFAAYFERRRTRLLATEVPTSVLSLLFIEMAAFTKLHETLRSIENLLDPSQTLSQWSNGDSNLQKKINNIAFAFGIYEDAIGYLLENEQRVLFQPSEVLPHPLYAWMAVLHAKDSSSRGYKLDDDKEDCYAYLAIQAHEEFLAKVAEIQERYPRHISADLIQKAQGLT